VRKFRYGEMEGEDQVGVVTGLAWTEVGGETLQIESVMLPGKGRMQTTGKLGDVMKESIDAARSYVRSKATTFGIKPPTFDKRTSMCTCRKARRPRMDPSAGVAMAVSIISVLTGIPVRRDVAMTGEVTLARSRAADRRLEGKAAGGIARRTHDGDHPAGEREGSGGDSGQCEVGLLKIVPVAPRWSRCSRWRCPPARADHWNETEIVPPRPPSSMPMRTP
jgi:hypothetical protein